MGTEHQPDGYQATTIHSSILNMDSEFPNKIYVENDIRFVHYVDVFPKKSEPLHLEFGEEIGSLSKMLPVRLGRLVACSLINSPMLSVWDF